MVDIMYQVSQDEAEFTRCVARYLPFLGFPRILTSFSLLRVMTEIIADVRMPIEKPAQREK